MIGSGEKLIRYNCFGVQNDLMEINLWRNTDKWRGRSLCVLIKEVV